MEMNTTKVKLSLSSLAKNIRNILLQKTCKEMVNQFNKTTPSILINSKPLKELNGFDKNNNLVNTETFSNEQFSNNNCYISITVNTFKKRYSLITDTPRTNNFSEEMNRIGNCYIVDHVFSERKINKTKDVLKEAEVDENEIKKDNLILTSNDRLEIEKILKSPSKKIITRKDISRYQYIKKLRKFCFKKYRKKKNNNLENNKKEVKKKFYSAKSNIRINKESKINKMNNLEIIHEDMKENKKKIKFFYENEKMEKYKCLFQTEAKKMKKEKDKEETTNKPSKQQKSNLNTPKKKEEDKENNNIKKITLRRKMKSVCNINFVNNKKDKEIEKSKNPKTKKMKVDRSLKKKNFENDALTKEIINSRCKTNKKKN